MILEQQIINAGGEIELVKNPLYSAESMANYTRSYQINTDNGVELLRYCNNKNGCGGRGYVMLEKSPFNIAYALPDRGGLKMSGLKAIESCPCTDKVIEKLEKKNG